MAILSIHSRGLLVGGGYWWQAPNGMWIYIESDEEPDEEDIIWV